MFFKAKSYFIYSFVEYIWFFVVVAVAVVVFVHFDYILNGVCVCVCVCLCASLSQREEKASFPSCHLHWIMWVLFDGCFLPASNLRQTTVILYLFYGLLSSYTVPWTQTHTGFGLFWIYWEWLPFCVPIHTTFSRKLWIIYFAFGLFISHLDIYYTYTNSTYTKHINDVTSIWNPVNNLNTPFWIDEKRRNKKRNQQIHKTSVKIE